MRVWDKRHLRCGHVRLQDTARSPARCGQGQDPPAVQGSALGRKSDSQCERSRSPLWLRFRLQDRAQEARDVFVLEDGWVPVRLAGGFVVAGDDGSGLCRDRCEDGTADRGARYVGGWVPRLERADQLSGVPGRHVFVAASTTMAGRVIESTSARTTGWAGKRAPVDGEYGSVDEVRHEEIVVVGRERRLEERAERRVDEVRRPCQRARSASDQRRTHAVRTRLTSTASAAHTPAP